MNNFKLTDFAKDAPAADLKKAIARSASILKKDLAVNGLCARHFIAKENGFANWFKMKEFIEHPYRGKWIEAFDTICTGWDCVKDENDQPCLYDTEEEVQAEIDYDVQHGYAEEGDFFVVKGEDYIEGRKAIFTGEKS